MGATSADSMRVYSISISIGVAIWLILVVKITGLRSIGINPRELKKLVPFGKQLIQSGFLISAQSYILVSYFLLDRYVTIKYFPEFGPEYAIAFSFCQIVFIGLNTIAYGAQQKVGEGIKTYSIVRYSNAIKMVIGFFLLVSVATTVLVFISSFYFVDYGKFYYSFAIIILFFGGYYVMSSFAVVAFYKDLTNTTTLFLLGALVTNLVLTFICLHFELGYYANLVKSGFLLLANAFLVDRLIRRVLQ